MVVKRFVVIRACCVSLEHIRELAWHAFLCRLVSQQAQIVDDFLDLMALMWVKRAIWKLFDVDAEKVGEIAFHCYLELNVFQVLKTLLYNFVRWTKQDGIVYVEDAEQVGLGVVEDGVDALGAFPACCFEFGAEVITPLFGSLPCTVGVC